MGIEKLFTTKKGFYSLAAAITIATTSYTGYHYMKTKEIEYPLIFCLTPLALMTYLVATTPTKPKS